MKMLVCTDGSEHGQKAVNEAARIAADMKKAEVTILNVYEGSPLPMYGEDVSSKIREEFRETKEEEGRRVLEEAVTVFKDKDIEPETRLLKGHPSTTINKVASEENYDIVILGSRGLSGLKKLLLGSVSNAVVQETRSNVLIVK